MTIPVVPRRSSNVFGGSAKFSTAYLLGMGVSVPKPAGMSSRSRVGNPGGMGGALGRVEGGGGEGCDAGRADDAGLGRAAVLGEAAVVNREAGAVGRADSGTGAASPLDGTWTTGWAVYLLPACGASEAKDFNASMASATFPYLASGDFCIRRSTTATNSSGVSGLKSLMAVGCLVWWAIIFSTAVPSGKGYWPVKQK